MKTRFPSLNLSARTVQRIVEEYRQQSSKAETAGQVNLSRKRKDCGGHSMKLTQEIAKLLIEINDKSWGRLSYKRLAGKLKEHDHPVATETVRSWCKELGAVHQAKTFAPAKMQPTRMGTR